LQVAGKNIKLSKNPTVQQANDYRQTIPAEILSSHR
jgi:hypothetical protein